GGVIGALAPGQDHHSTTGEPGGLWSQRGCSSHALVGIGTEAIGFDSASPYRRTPASYESALAFMFEGIDGDLLGQFGLHLGAAPGWELDPPAPAREPPAAAIVVARSTRHDGSYERVPELMRDFGETEQPVADEIGADMVYLVHPSGGRV